MHTCTQGVSTGMFDVNVPTSADKVGAGDSSATAGSPAGVQMQNQDSMPFFCDELLLDRLNSPNILEAICEG